MRPPRKENAMLTPEQIELIRRRKNQLMRLGGTLRRSGYDMFATLISQIAEDIEALISAAQEK